MTNESWRFYPLDRISKMVVASARPSTSANLFSRSTKAIFFNYKRQPIQRMLDFDYICGRDTPSVCAIVTQGAPPGGFQKEFFGKAEVAIPVYGDINSAAIAHPDADVLINFASYRSAFKSSTDALAQPTFRTIAIIAEGVPERATRQLIADAAARGKHVIGPATVGGV